MTRRALALLLLLSACTAVRSPAPATMPARALPGRVAQGGHGAIVEVRIVYEDGFVQVVSSGVDTATPTPTNTRTPVPSATRTATLTPPPTNTPRPTSTVTPTPTPSLVEIESTPTAEDFNTPSPTPRPTSTVTPTPTPPLGACVLVVTADPALNVRVSPNVLTGAVLGQVVKDQKLRPNGYVVVSGMKWYQIWWLPDQVGYVRSDYVTQQTGTDCSTLPEITLPPPKVFWDGFHTLAGDGASAILAPQYVGRFHLLKCLDNGFALCQQAKAANPDLITICRTYRFDSPPLWAYSSPETWWDMIGPYLPPGCTYYEVQNESDPPPEYGDLWAQFNIDMARIVARERGAALLGYSAGPGHPDIPLWKSMITYLQWTLGPEGIAPNGFRHGLATHSSAFAPASIVLPAGSWINQEWIADRDRLMCKTMLLTYGFSCEGVIVINSELGWSDGYQGTKDLFTCDQQGQMYRETKRRKMESGAVDGFALWNLGAVGQWSSVHTCLAQILQ